MGSTWAMDIIAQSCGSLLLTGQPGDGLVDRGKVGDVPAGGPLDLDGVMDRPAVIAEYVDDREPGIIREVPAGY